MSSIEEIYLISISPLKFLASPNKTTNVNYIIDIIMKFAEYNDIHMNVVCEYLFLTTKKVEYISNFFVSQA